MFMLQIVLASLCLAAPSPDAGVLTSARVLDESSPSDWRRVDPSNTLYLDLPGGRVVIELAAGFAPAHVENIRTLAREHYFDDLAILRSQDNYVAQWGDPNADDRTNAGDRAHAKSLGSARTKLPAEFSRPSQGLAFTKLSDGDVYTREVGWADGFPVGRDPGTGQIWLAHCYGIVGAGRNNPADSSNGAELYVVTGHSPRHLDRNITAVGRVLQGMELLSSLPRGTGALGFYEKPQQRVPLKRVMLASAISAADRTEWEALRTDTPTFQQWVEARRNRREPWFVYPVGHVELCNVPLPARELKKPAH